jgi:hypothetical protein
MAYVCRRRTICPKYLYFFLGWDLSPLRSLFSGPLGSGSLGLFVSSPLGPCKSQHCGHIGLLCIPRMIHEGDCVVIGGANDDCRGNRSTRRKPAPAPLCPTTNPTWPGPVSNRGPQRWEASDKTAWAMVRPYFITYSVYKKIVCKEIHHVQWTSLLHSSTNWLALTPYKQQTNSGALFRQRTIPTDRPLLFGEVSANLSG